MYSNRGFQTYQNISVMTAPPERLLLMLYEGLIKNIKLAKEAIEEGNPDSRRACLRKARDIVTELMSALNFEIGGEIAVNLHRLYRYINGRLIQADISPDAEPLDHAMRVVDILNDAWVRAVEILQEEESNGAQALGR
jgi:flagellar protein FliS